MESSYLSSLDHLARRRYLLKLNIDGEVFPDPYGIDEKEWGNDVTTWPDLEFIVLAAGRSLKGSTCSKNHICINCMKLIFIHFAAYIVHK